MSEWYRKLWTAIGGRPWTYILRDSWGNYEIFWVLGLLIIGLVIGRFVDFWWALSGLGIMTGGFILGHIFWGTAHIPGQKE